MKNPTVLRNLSIRMKACRVAKKINIRDAAKECKISPTTYCAVENGSRLYITDHAFTKIETWLQWGAK